MSHQSDLIATDIEAYLKQHEQKELLRFLTCGSVDDGKSTLIGRLLHDSKMIYEDQLAAVKRDSSSEGSTGGELDLALLTDGLKAEREQGITIDVAYRYFSTAKRKFIIADTPGHEQYTRNMATGASTCDLAVILIDARHGVLTQTKRHSFIVSLLGIKHVVVAINKMDLVDFSEQAFNRIREDYLTFIDELDLPDIRFLPMSALNGDNVVEPSPAMPWYDGPALMEVLETVEIASDRNFDDFRFPVQYVIRPDLDFRGFGGTIASGIVHPGDDVIALPSGKRTQIKSISTYDGDLPEAFPPMSVTLTLADEIDVSRGDMIVHPDNVPEVAKAFDASIVWMAEKPLDPGRSYLFKQKTTTTSGTIQSIYHQVDVNTLERRTADSLQLNEIGLCHVVLAQPIAWDPYTRNRGTGGFIIIDRLTNVTVGAGMIVGHADHDNVEVEAAPDAISSSISTEERVRRYSQEPVTVLLTGTRGAGKTTLAYALERRLFDTGHPSVVLDGRALRSGLSNDLPYTAAGAEESLRRAAEAAKLVNDSGLICICSVAAANATTRHEARNQVGSERFFEIHLTVPGDIAERRREASGRTHIAQADIPYEEPENADLVMDTTLLTPDACVDRIMALLHERKVFTKPLEWQGFGADI